MAGALGLAAWLASTSAVASIAVAGIHGYQHSLGPLLGRAGVRCRFTPSCSHYAAVVIARDGLIRGAWASASRVARCTPWTPMGTVDAP